MKNTIAIPHPFSICRAVIREELVDPLDVIGSPSADAALNLAVKNAVSNRAVTEHHESDEGASIK